MLQTRPALITFPVDEVTPATEPRPECKTHEALKAHLRTDIESCCDYSASVLRDVDYHGLLAAVYIAFCEHRPLVLSPDHIWLTIAQGVAQHMTVHAERLRPRFVAHEGRLTLEVRVDEFVKGSPENPWPQAFAAWSAQIREHIGPATYDPLACDFSTTGPAERAASDITLMDIFERYFHYEAVAICGIPEVTLEGTVDDWRRLRTKLDVLERFDLGWWAGHLRPICDEFVNAAEGRVNQAHWRAICKRREAYGGGIVNGWIGQLFPYLREYWQGPPKRLNPIFESGQGFHLSFAPSGLSMVPFVWRIEPRGVPNERWLRYEMEAIGGFVGVEQHPETGALRAKIGWAVREVSALDSLLSRLGREHQTRPGASLGHMPPVPATDDVMSHTAPPAPADMAKFYHHTDGVEVNGRTPAIRFRVLPTGGLSHAWGPTNLVELTTWRRCYGRSAQFYRFCDLPDGHFLAINAERHQDVPADQRAEARARQRRAQARMDAEDERIQGVLRELAQRSTAAFTKAERDGREHQFRLDSTVWQEARAELDAIRAARVAINMIVLCRPGTVGKPGRCPVVAESFTEFLERALACTDRYWWDEPDWQGYGDAYERLRQD